MAEKFSFGEECSSAKEMWPLEKYNTNPRSAGMDKEESSAESFSSQSRKGGLSYDKGRIWIKQSKYIFFQQL